MADQLDTSQLIWIPDDKTCYELARILQDYVVEPGQSVQKIITESLEGKRKERTFLRSEVYDVDKSHIKDLNDLIEMNSIHEAPLLDILRKRWLKDKMYTYTGDFLVSINPYHQITGLYNEPLQYLDLSPTYEKKKKLPPHVYGIANHALREIMKPPPSEDDEDEFIKISQSIIVTGESGAGKTEAAKQVMNFLTLANKQMFPSAGKVADVIKNVILDSNALFEAFGNAKTVRNDNSSRFGKYIRLEYTQDNQLFAADTETFLLEKSRLVSVGKNDRNYHIFYQMIRGLDDNIKNNLRLKKVDDFKILTGGGCTVITTEQDDINEFTHVKKAFSEMNCTDDEIARLWELLASVLHLGNVEVKPAAADGETCQLELPTMSLEEITKLLGVTVEAFKRALTIQKVEVKMRNEKYDKILSVDDTKNNILAFIKWLYGAAFNWLVSKVNAAHKSIADQEHRQVVKFIGILDIFGFEIFQDNTFEQLCINYTNERLQQQFNELAFELEQQEYAKEGLDWTTIKYRDNQVLIDLIGKKPKGLLIILEEHSLMNREPDDQALLNTYHRHHFGQHANYAKPKFGNEGFVIKHFAGEVTYNIGGFISKNNDSLQDDLSTLLATSTNTFVQDILTRETKAPTVDNSVEDLNGGGGMSLKGTGGGTRMAATVSVSYRFRHQLDRLIATLRSTNAFYIKCIKPNNDKKAGLFDANLVITQLRYSGVLEIVRIRREGYPTRVLYQDFYNEYKDLAKVKNWPHDASKCTKQQLKQYCKQLCEQFVPTPESYKLGNKYLFLHHYVPNIMMNALHIEKTRLATKIQTAYRRYRARKKYIEDIKVVRITRRRSVAATHLQANIRAMLQRKKYLAEQARIAREKLELESSIKIQAAARAAIQRRKYLAELARINREKLEKESAIKIQAAARAAIQRRKYLAEIARLNRLRLEKESATKIQAGARAAIQRRQYLIDLTEHKRIKATQLQAVFRGYQIRKQNKIEAELRAIILIQSVLRTIKPKRRFQEMKQASLTVECATRVYLAKKLRAKLALELKSALRMQQAVRRFQLNNSLRNHIIAFHELCKNAGSIHGGIKLVKESIMKCPYYYRNKWQHYCTMYHSAAMGGQYELIKNISLSPYDILEKDISHTRMLHYAGTHPDVMIIKHLADIINTIKTSLDIRLDTNDDDTEEDDNNLPTDTNATTDLMTGLPILKAGWMKKSSSILGIKTFKRRWCVLTEESFILYHSVNSGPAGYISIEGCIIERQHNNEPLISIKRPELNPNIKKSLFSSDAAHSSYTMKVDNETIAQDWLTALKLAAGVRPFRDGPVQYINLNIRSQWVRLLNTYGQSALHYLAQQKVPEEKNKQLEMIQVASWLVENGCKILVKDNYGKTCIDYAKDISNDILVQFLSRRQASITNNSNHKTTKKGRVTMSVFDRDIHSNDENDTDNKTKDTRPSTHKQYVLSNLKLKGFSYLQVHFEKFQYGSSAKAQRVDEWENPRLSVTVVNEQNEPIEMVQEIDTPAYITTDTIYWGYTWYMQTPLENISNNFGIVVRVLHDHNPSVPLVRYNLDKETIDTGYTKLYLNTLATVPLPTIEKPVDNMSFLNAFTPRRLSAALPPPTSTGPLALPDSTLETEFQITKLYRTIDIETHVKPPTTPKTFDYISTNRDVYDVIDAYQKAQSGGTTTTTTNGIATTSNTTTGTTTTTNTGRNGVPYQRLVDKLPVPISAASSSKDTQLSNKGSSIQDSTGAPNKPRKPSGSK